jgi:hypothetical protein
VLGFGNHVSCLAHLQLDSGEFSRVVELLEDSETNPGLCAMVKTSVTQLKRLHTEAAWNSVLSLL